MPFLSVDLLLSLILLKSLGATSPMGLVLEVKEEGGMEGPCVSEEEEGGVGRGGWGVVDDVKFMSAGRDGGDVSW